MARNAFWLTLIAAACAAIVAGYLQAAATTHPPPIARLRSAHSLPALSPAAVLLRVGGDETTADPFAQDDVVADRPRTPQPQWQRARLATVVALCGASAAAEAGFLRLGFPIAFVIDPRAPQSLEVAQMVRAARQMLFVQVSGAPAAGGLQRLRQSYGSIDGVASRDPAGMAAALRGTGLAFLDERGDADAASFVALHVVLVQRDITVDDRTGAGYVAFMLTRAAALSRRVGPLVVLLRPLPSTLAALRAFAASQDVQMVAVH